MANFSRYNEYLKLERSLLCAVSAGTFSNTELAQQRKFQVHAGDQISSGDMAKFREEDSRELASKGSWVATAERK